MTKAELLYALEPYKDEDPILVKLYSSTWPKGKIVKPQSFWTALTKNNETALVLTVHTHDKRIENA